MWLVRSWSDDKVVVVIFRVAMRVRVLLQPLFGGTQGRRRRRLGLARPETDVRDVVSVVFELGKVRVAHQTLMLVAVRTSGARLGCCRRTLLLEVHCDLVATRRVPSWPVELRADVPALLQPVLFFNTAARTTA